MENKIVSSIAGGVAGTAVITVLMLLASAIGIPGIDYGHMLAEFTQTSVIGGLDNALSNGYLTRVCICIFF